MRSNRILGWLPREVVEVLRFVFTTKQTCTNAFLHSTILGGKMFFHKQNQQLFDPRSMCSSWTMPCDHNHAHHLAQSATTSLYCTQVFSHSFAPKTLLHSSRASSICYHLALYTLRLLASFVFLFRWGGILLHFFSVRISKILVTFFLRVYCFSFYFDSTFFFDLFAHSF